MLPVRSLNSAGLGGGVLEALGDKRSAKKENLKCLEVNILHPTTISYCKKILNYCSQEKTYFTMNKRQ